MYVFAHTVCKVIKSVAHNVIIDIHGMCFICDLKLVINTIVVCTFTIVKTIPNTARHKHPSLQLCNFVAAE